MAAAIPLNDETRILARRCVWFRSPEDALADPTDFIAHVLTYGAPKDVSALRQMVSDDDLRDAVDHAPPGVFDARSWAYWNLMLFGRRRPPPSPTRRLP